MTNVLIYDAQTGSKLDSITRLFNQRAFVGLPLTFRRVSAADLLDHLDEQTDLLVLPGARAGTPYRTQLVDEKVERIKHLTQNGMQVLGICAGAYVLSRVFEYTDHFPEQGGSPQTKHIRDEPLGLVSAKAIGPDPVLQPIRQPDVTDPWSLYAAAHVGFDSSFLSPGSAAHLTLSLGPSFYDLDPAQCRPLATFNQTGAAAIIQFDYGQGGGILSGPALEVGGLDLLQFVHPRHHGNPARMDVLSKIENSFPVWADMWGEMLTRLLPRQSAHHEQIRRNMYRRPRLGK